MAEVDPAHLLALRQTEQGVSFEWRPGQIILDLYEVRKVTEGFGKGAREKDYHEGGFGRVYKVWHRTWLREMAVKTPSAGAFITQEQKDTFTRECETWVNLGLHAHIAACHYVRDLGGAPRVFSEYADAGTLEEWIKSRRLYEANEQTALATILDYGIQFAWGLHYSHERKVIHQDVKPLNALIWNDGTLKVTDFGLAGARVKAAIAGTSDGMHSIMVSSGAMTPSHCSPEQAMGRNLDRRTDVWSWAVSVLEMFQGGVVWRSGSIAAEALEAFLEQNGEERGIPSMPEEVAAVLRHCFQINPSDRPRTLYDCALALCGAYQTVTGGTYRREEPRDIRDTPDALNNRALSLIDLGQYDEPDRLFERALQLDKQHLAATYNSGLMRWRSGACTDEEAIGALDDIKKDQPSNSALECTIGWARMESGDFIHAQSDFEKAIQLGDEFEAQRGLESSLQLAQPGSGQCIRRFLGHTATVRHLGFSPDGRYAFSGALDRTIRVWDVSTGDCLRTIGEHSRQLFAVAFSPDGRFALTGSSDKTLKLMDLETGEHLRSFEGHRGTICSVTFSPDNRYALSGSWDNTIRLWVVATGQCLRSFIGHSEPIRSLTFSPDGRTALSASDDETIRLWDLSAGICMRTYAGHLSLVRAAVFSPDLRYILTCDVKGIGHLWDLATGDNLKTYHGFYCRDSLEYLSDGCNAITGSGQLWDMQAGRCLRTFHWNENRVSCVKCSSDRRLIIAGSSDGTISLADISSVKKNRYTSPSIYSVAVSAEEALVHQDEHRSYLSCAREALEGNRIERALEYLRKAREIPGFARDPESLELHARIGARGRIQSCCGGWLKRTFEEIEDDIYSVKFTLDGRHAVTVGETIRLWEIGTGKCVRVFGEACEFVLGTIALSPDGTYGLAGGYNEAIISLWNMETGNSLRTLRLNEKITGRRSVAFSPDSRLAIYGGEDSAIRLWDVTTGQCLHTYTGHTKSVRSVVFSPDGSRILSGSTDKTMRLWNASSGECIRTFAKHEESVIEGLISPDGRQAYSACLDGTFRVWDVATGQCLRHFGENVSMQVAIFSADGRFALAGGGTLGLWDMTTGICLRAFEGLDWFYTVAISPDSRFILASSGKIMKLWEIDWEYE